MKIHKHECKSLKEFNKIIRKYIKYFKNTYILRTYWYTWVWWDCIGIDNLKKILPYANRLAEKNQSNLKHIINTIINNYNWSFKHKDGKIYYLQGVEISNEDYYYIYVAKDGSKQYNTCVGRFNDIA